MKRIIVVALCCLMYGANAQAIDFKTDTVEPEGNWTFSGQSTFNDVTITGSLTATGEDLTVSLPALTALSLRAVSTDTYKINFDYPSVTADRALYAGDYPMRIPNASSVDTDGNIIGGGTLVDAGSAVIIGGDATTIATDTTIFDGGTAADY